MPQCKTHESEDIYIYLKVDIWLCESSKFFNKHANMISIYKLWLATTFKRKDALKELHEEL